MEQPTERPRLLAVICILTFIGSGMTLFSNTMIFTFFDQFKTIFASQGGLEFLGTKMDVGSLLDISPLFYLLQATFSALSLAGAIMMWNFRKTGFHLYAVAQILMLIIPKLFLPALPFPVFELSVSALFVYLYYKHLPLMK